ncbi:MAG: hypothetical protein QOJ19_10 [Acidimicrobiia bacterium]|nr:hypothetical protein [Acidimicrobiia bacterium]
MIALGVLAAVELARRRAPSRGATRDDISAIATWAVPAGLVGARLYHVITDWWRFKHHLIDVVKIWQGGLGIPGGLVAGVGVGLWVAHRRGIRPADGMDIVAPALPLAQAIGRWGNWWNQELFGRPTTLPWGLKIDPAHRPPGYDANATYHPTFLYESLWNVGLCVVLLLIDRRRRLRAGQLFWLYVTGYGVGRLWVEALRIDEATEIGPFRVNTWVSLVAIVAGIVGFVVQGRRARPIATGAVPAASVPGSSAAETVSAGPGPEAVSAGPEAPPADTTGNSSATPVPAEHGPSTPVPAERPPEAQPSTPPAGGPAPVGQPPPSQLSATAPPGRPAHQPAGPPPTGARPPLGPQPGQPPIAPGTVGPLQGPARPPAGAPTPAGPLPAGPAPANQPPPGRVPSAAPPGPSGPRPAGPATQRPPEVGHRPGQNPYAPAPPTGRPPPRPPQPGYGAPPAGYGAPPSGRPPAAPPGSHPAPPAGQRPASPPPHTAAPVPAGPPQAPSTSRPGRPPSEAGDDSVAEDRPGIDRPGPEGGVGQHNAADSGQGVDPAEGAGPTEVTERPR